MAWASSRPDAARHDSRFASPEAAKGGKKVALSEELQHPSKILSAKDGRETTLSVIDPLHCNQRTAILQTATAIRRKRGPSLSRRIGQTGNVFQHCKPWSATAPTYGRYWIDVPGAERKRRTVALGICSSRSVARRKLREHIEREGVNSKEAFATNTAPATTFRAQAEKWIAYMSTRRRKPVKPATICGWKQSLRKWIVASAVDADGEQLYPRKWNHDFIGMPIVRRENQRRPTVTTSEVEEILASTKPRYAVLFALLAGTGLRIGEALGLKVTDLSSDCRVLHVRRSIWNGQEQEPKTPNAVREVDIAEPLAAVLREHTAGKSGYLFAASTGRPLQQRNVLRALHATGKKVGFHAFRRFRTETLRRARTPEDLVRLWLGHSKETVTDFYADGLKWDSAWRREWCERVGLGFSVGLLGLQNAVRSESEKAA